MTALETASRKKLHELLDLIREVDERRYGPEWGIESQGDVADGHRNLMHVLEGGLFSHFDADPERGQTVWSGIRPRQVALLTLRNESAALARSLRANSTGRMRPLHDDLPRCAMPVTPSLRG